MSLEVASLTAMLSLDDSDFKSGMNSASQQLNKIQGAFEATGQKITSVGSSITSAGMSMMGLSAPLLGIGVLGVKAFGDFEHTMTEISARTGIVGEDLEAIGDFALEMGAKTVFSGQQASDAFLDLLTSGQSAEEAYGTLPHVMNLAAAGNLELGQSADTLTDIMSMFGLSVDDTVGSLSAAEYVANSLTQASQVSSASVGMLAEAFVNVGGIASGFGLSVDETNAALAVLAEGGLKGAEAGTNLKSMLLGMSATTDSTQEAWMRLGTSMYDSEGNMKNLNSLLGEIRDGLEGLPMEDQNEIIMGLAGSYGQLSMRTLLFGNDLQETRGAMEESASAAEVAEKMMESWNNTVNSLMGSMESFGIEVLMPFVDEYLKPLVKRMIEVVNSATAWAKENPELTATILKVVAAIAVAGPILVAVGGAVSMLGTVISGLGVVLGIVLSPIGLLVAAIAALGVAFVTDFGGIRTWFDSNIRPWFEGLSAMFKTGGLKNVGIYITRTVIDPIKAAFASLVSGGQVAKDLEAFAGSIMTNISSGVSNLGSWFNDKVINPLANSVGDMVKGAGGAKAIFKKLQGFGFKLLENGFNIAKGIVKFLYNRLFKPLGDAIGEYISSGNLQRDLSKLGAVFMDAIAKGIGLLGQALNWVNDNLIRPLAEAISNYVTSGKLMDDLRALGSMFMGAIAGGINLIGRGITWVYENLIKPLGDAIYNFIDSGQLADILIGLGKGFLDLIGKGITFVQSIPAWIYDNLIKPLFTSVGDAASGGGGGLLDSLMGFGQSILEGIGQGLTALGSIASWFFEKVIDPFWTAITEHLGIGIVWEKLKEFGQMFLEGIAHGLTFIQDIATWLYDNLIAPLFGGIENESATGGSVWSALSDLGGIFLNAMAEGLTLVSTIGVWLRDTFVQPIIDAIGGFIGVGDLYDKLVDFGSGFLTWIAEGIGDVAKWIHETIVKPMGAAINDILVSLGFLPDPRFMGYYDSPSGGGGTRHAMGGNVWQGRTHIVGEQGPELFVPSSDGMIVPNHELGSGMGGSTIQIENLTINATGDGSEIARTFEDELANIIRSRG